MSQAREVPRSGRTLARSRRALRTTPLAGLAAVISLGVASPAFAEAPLDFDQLVPANFRYVKTHERIAPSVSFRRNESRAVEAPTRYRTSSVLQYTRPLGSTGLQLRVKAPLNPRKIVKVEIRF